MFISQCLERTEDLTAALTTSDSADMGYGLLYTRLSSTVRRRLARFAVRSLYDLTRVAVFDRVRRCGRPLICSQVVKRLMNCQHVSIGVKLAANLGKM